MTDILYNQKITQDYPSNHPALSPQCTHDPSKFFSIYSCKPQTRLPPTQMQTVKKLKTNETLVFVRECSTVVVSSSIRHRRNYSPNHPLPKLYQWLSLNAWDLEVGKVGPITEAGGVSTDTNPGGHGRCRAIKHKHLEPARWTDIGIRWGCDGTRISGA